MFVYVFIKPTYPTSDVTTFAESAVYIFTFLRITWELKEIVYYSKRPISLFFHAPRGEKCNLPKFAHETNPCAKIATKFAHEFAHMHFLSLQRLNLLEICVQVCI